MEKLARLGLECGGRGRGTGPGPWAADGAVSCAVSRTILVWWVKGVLSMTSKGISSVSAVGCGTENSGVDMELKSSMWLRSQVLGVKMGTD